LKSKHELEQQQKGTTAQLQKEVLELRLDVQEKGVAIINHLDTIQQLTSEKEGIEAISSEFR